MQTWSQSWAKAQMWTRASGFSEGPQKLYSPELLSCGVSFQNLFTPGACHIFLGTRGRSRLVRIVAEACLCLQARLSQGRDVDHEKGIPSTVLMSAS